MTKPTLLVLRRLRRAAAAIAFFFAVLLLPAAASAQTAQDHGGNRIEPFRQFGIVVDGSPQRTRACSEAREWCAEIIRTPPDGILTLVISPGEGIFDQAPTLTYLLAPDLDGAQGVTIWDRIVIQADGAVLVGLVFSSEVLRPGFRSYQRRLLLLRAGPGITDVATPVLEAPLSGLIQQDVCAPADQQANPDGACENRFSMSTLVTLTPILSPGRPGLILMVRSHTTPGRRLRWEGLREPVERSGHDEVVDPTCTYSRSYQFDDAAGRYVPDAPTPDCRDFLEP